MHCPTCGAPNPDDAPRCANCGAWLEPAADDGGTLIDVSGGTPRIVPVETPADEPRGGAWPRAFPAREFEFGAGRVVVAGGRSCLLFGVVLTLLFFCACWLLAQLLGNPGGLFAINWL